MNHTEKTDAAKKSYADLKGFVIPAVTGERMYACVFTPLGQGPRPTVLLLHGYPGDENNFDLAHAFQRAGYTAAVFHYRGTWGSEGLFSLTNMLEDVSSALAFIRDRTGEEAYRFDARRLFLIGHSMGGFATLQTAANRSGLLGAAAVAPFDFSLTARSPGLREAVRRELEDCLPIRRIGLNELMDEMDRNAEKWSFVSLADRLSCLPVCLVGAESDAVSVPKHHVLPLYRALSRSGNPDVTLRMVNDGHCLSGTRTELAGLLLDWADGILKNHRG